MASAMESSTLRKGSDFFDEDMKECQPCSSEGNSVAAQTFCVDCDAYLCQRCSTYHKALKSTKTHTLVKPDEAKKVAPKAPQDKCSRKCSVHPAKAVKYFCVAHSHLGCSVCCNIDHKRCDDVEHIQTVATDIKRHAGFNKFDKDLRTVGTSYKTGLDDIKKDMENIQVDEQKLRNAFKEFRNKVNNGLDELEREIFKQAKSIKDEEIKKLDTLSKNLQKTKDDVDGLIKKLDLFLSSGKRCDAYVLSKTEVNLLTSFQEELVKNTEGKTYQRYDFKANMDITKAINLGNLTTRNDSVSSSSAGLPRRVAMDGPAMAKLMKPGARVRRGKDWRYEDQDGGTGQKGTVQDIFDNGNVRVKWDIGRIYNYRMGKAGAYELEIAQ